MWKKREKMNLYNRIVLHQDRFHWITVTNKMGWTLLSNWFRGLKSGVLFHRSAIRPKIENLGKFFLTHIGNRSFIQSLCFRPIAQTCPYTYSAGSHSSKLRVFCRASYLDEEKMKTLNGYNWVNRLLCLSSDIILPSSRCSSRTGKDQSV